MDPAEDKKEYIYILTCLFGLLRAVVDASWEEDMHSDSNTSLALEGSIFYGNAN